MPDPDALLKAWVETVKDYAIFLLDAAGNVASWNDGAERITGYRQEEILGRPVATFFTPEDLERGASDWEMGEALRVGRASDDRWHVRQDGGRFWASGVLNALRGEDGTLHGFVKALRDLTERKQLEDELRRRADDLAEADRRKNEFLAMLSHELRNPLAPILNTLFALRQTSRTDEAPEILQARLLIERQVGHMKAIVDDLLDVSRVSTHKMQLEFRRVPLGQVIDDAVEAARTFITERRHELTVAVDPDPIPVDADPTRLEQVIVNLLNNAAKYTEPGGSIWLTARREGDQAVIRVTDTGIGIAPEMLPQVVELFRQVDHSPDRRQGGLGIGLTLARSLVELHGGTIEAHSEGLGKGAEFTVRLPAKSPEKTAGMTAARGEARPAVRPLRVLVVEDNADSARSLGMLLHWAGHRVYIADDGPTAVLTAREEPLDVVLLDIGLPGMNGYEVAREIRARKPLPLVAMTGYIRDANAAADFDHYLVKPVDPDELLRLLACMGEAE
jgi:PAS domain S-box-containing protein